MQSPAGPNEPEPRNSTVSYPCRIRIIPRPPRQKRILWDQFHSLRYPPGYLPRDNLKIKSDPLDWRADHIHTNFRDMYTHLRNAGYYVEVLGVPLTCVNTSLFGTLLIVDPEEEFFAAELQRLQQAVLYEELSVIVFADWYNTSVMRKIKFYDENTRQWWMPDTGGANIPALNELLAGFGVALGDRVLEGYYALGDHSMYYASGASIVRWPQTNGSILVERQLHDQGQEFISGGGAGEKAAAAQQKQPHVILGLLQANRTEMGGGVVDGGSDTYRAHPAHQQLEQPQHSNDARHEEANLEPVNSNHPIINKRVLLGVSSEATDSGAGEPRVLQFSNKAINDNLKKFDRLNDVDAPATVRPLAAEANADDVNDAAEDLYHNPINTAADDGEANGVNGAPGAVNQTTTAAIAAAAIGPSVPAAPLPVAYQKLQLPLEGRIAVYGDSNCLDSTQLEKPCFWLLDALLEYTMAGHVPALLADLNRRSHIDLNKVGRVLPVRVTPNNLHLYSKVLDRHNVGQKRPLPECPARRWEQPVFLDVTAPVHLRPLQPPVLYDEAAALSNGVEGLASVRRKLESQKGWLLFCLVFCVR